MRADLRAREVEITALRSGAMSALASRQAAVDKRRLEAIDQLWSATIALGQARVISTFMSAIKFEDAAKEAAKSEKFRTAMGAFGTGFDPKNMGGQQAQAARPFVTQMAWATYTALLSIVTVAVMRWTLLKTGVGQTDIVDYAGINNLLKTALPHCSEYIDEHGASGYHFLIEQLEAQLLRELQSMLTGIDSDKASLTQAAEILKQSSALMDQMNAQVKPSISN